MTQRWIIVGFVLAACSYCMSACGRVNFDRLAKNIQVSGDAAINDDSSIWIEGTCADLALNQDEIAIDCGGVCGACEFAPSCRVLLAEQPGLPSDAYRIDVDGKGPIAPFDVFCEMVEDGGGWTLAAKMLGTSPAFAYDSPLWTDQQILNLDQATTTDIGETKVPSFFALAFDQVRVGMFEPNTYKNWLVMDQAGSSLSALFSGAFVPTTIGPTRWLEMLEWQSALQPGCNREGFNVVAGGALGDSPPFNGTLKVRIGILGDDDPNVLSCSSSDSFFGFGATAPLDACGFMWSVTTGNGATCNGGGNRNVSALGYIMVR